MQHKTDFGLEVRSHTVYANYQKRYQNTYAEGPLEFIDQGVFELTGYKRDEPRTNVFSQNDFIYRFETTPIIKHQWLNGFEFGNQKSYNGINFPCFNLDCQQPSLDTPFFMPTVYNPISFINAVQKRNTNLDLAAGYSQDQIAITDYVDVIAGIRYDRFNLHFKGGDVPPIGAVPQDELNEQGGIINSKLNRIDNLWSPRMGLVVKPFPQLSLYGSYSRSYVPMAGDQFVLLTPSLANLAPQGFQNYEAGFKAELMPRLLFTGALYQLNRSNQPVVVTATDGVLANTQTNGGELAITGNVTDLWQVSTGWGHQGNFVKQVNSAGVGTVPLGYGVGKDVPFVPKNTFSFWNKYDFSSFADAKVGTFGLGMGVVYNAQYFAALDNTVIVPGYARVDSALYFKVSEQISGQLNVENLLGAKYYVAASNNNNIMPGSPRAAFLTINAKF
jgi:catecholate siderophore receptor